MKILIPANAKAHAFKPDLNAEDVAALLSVEQCGRRDGLGFRLLYRAYVYKKVDLESIFSSLLELPSFYEAHEDAPGKSDVLHALNSFYAALVADPDVHERLFKDFLGLGSRFWVDPKLPYHTPRQSLAIFQGGVNLLRRRTGEIKSENFNLYALARAPASTLFQSAILHDDIDAIEDLYAKYPGFPKKYPSNLIRSFIAELDALAEEGVEIPLIPRVRDRYDRHLATKEYFERIRLALEDDDEVLLDQLYDPVMTKRCGLQIMEALLGRVSERMSISKVALKFLCRQVGEGLDLYPLFLKLSYDAFVAIDRAGEEIDPFLVIDKCLTYIRVGRSDYAIFLLMLTIEQIRVHPSAEECFRQLYELTGDIRFIAEVESLSYRGQIFMKELGV